MKSFNYLTYVCFAILKSWVDCDCNMISRITASVMHPISETSDDFCILDMLYKPLTSFTERFMLSIIGAFKLMLNHSQLKIITHCPWYIVKCQIVSKWLVSNHKSVSF
jgi:hypothetical protein